MIQASFFLSITWIGSGLRKMLETIAAVIPRYPTGIRFTIEASGSDNQGSEAMALSAFGTFRKHVREIEQSLRRFIRLQSEPNQQQSGPILADHPYLLHSPHLIITILRLHQHRIPMLINKPANLKQTQRFRLTLNLYRPAQLHNEF